MSVLHSIVPLEYIYSTEYEVNPRVEMMYRDMLVEVEYKDDNIILSRLINAPLNNYLDSQFKPGTVIGKIQSFV